MLQRPRQRGRCFTCMAISRPGARTSGRRVIERALETRGVQGIRAAGARASREAAGETLFIRRASPPIREMIGSVLPAHRANFDHRARPYRGNCAGERNRLLLVLAFENVKAADLFLGFREGSVANDL